MIQLMISGISNIHFDILDSQRRELLEKLLPFTNDFILGGGTALALQLNHRQSFDFDFFSASPIRQTLLEKLSRMIPIKKIAVNTSDELTFFTAEQIKVTFLYYPFEYIPPIIMAENGLRLFSIEDIATKKAYTIGRRGVYRDYFDLYTILNYKHMSLSHLISNAKKVYGSIFDEKIFLQQLVYFDDVANFDILPVASQSVPEPEAVKRYFEELVAAYA